MSGYIGLNRTGFGPFDDSLSLIEEAGDSYHHTSSWLDEGWKGEKPYIDRINESIEFAANSYSDLIDALTTQVAALEAEVERLSAAHVKACQANADSQAELAAEQLNNT